MRNFGFGFIALWFGSLASIPFGWALCDGTQGTPDLTDNFVIGAGDTYNPADSGGSVIHNHDFTSDLHTHSPSAAFLSKIIGPHRFFYSNEVAIGTTDNANSLPPYDSLVYIMEL